MNFFRLQNNRKGFTLTEVVIGAGILGIVAVGLIAVTRNQTNASIKAQVDGDMNQAISQINAYLASPASCNANFKGLAAATDGPLNGISSCTGSGTVNCYNAGQGTPAVQLPKIAPAQPFALDANWTTAVTKISNRVRIKNITYTANTVTGVALTVLTLKVYFETRPYPDKLDVTNLLIPRPVSLLPPKVFTTPVVMDGGTSTIKGCPRAFNSTVPYGG